MPRQEHIQSPLSGRKMALICLGAALYGSLTACPAPEEPPVPGPETPIETAPGRPGSGAQGIPRIAFVEHSLGLKTGGTWREHPLLHDFNGDGRADVIASNREEDGLNAWRAPTSEDDPWQLAIEGLPRNLMYGGSDAGDLDGDGDPDLVFGSHLDGLRVFLNSGDLQWVESPSAHENPFRMLDVCLGHLNDDEHLDVVGIAHFGGSSEDAGASIYIGDGEGSFRRLPESETILGRSIFGTVTELMDLDGDGDDDLFFSCEPGPRVFLTQTGPDGLSWTPASEGLPKTSIGNITRACHPVDLDLDGIPELIAGHLSDPNVRLEDKQTAGVFAWDPEATRWNLIESGLPTRLSITDAAAADFDGDSHMDILLVSIEQGVVIYRGDGALGFTLAGQVTRTANPRTALGDVNGDGRVDVCVLHGATKSRRDGGGVQVFLNTAEAWRNL